MAKKLNNGFTAVLKYLIENPDIDKMRNTLTRMHERLPEIPRSTLHSQLKSLVKLGYLIEESDEILSINNQPMKIIRYTIVESRIAMIRELLVNAKS